jgi:hypothetical protein
MASGSEKYIYIYLYIIIKKLLGMVFINIFTYIFRDNRFRYSSNIKNITSAV